MTQELLTLQNLAKYYASAQSVVVGLNRTNLTFCRGEFVAITGESGSGKSTLGNCVNGLIPFSRTSLPPITIAPIGSATGGTASALSPRAMASCPAARCRTT